MTLTDQNMGERTVTAFFDTRPAADKAMADVVRLGIPQSQINVVAGNDGATSETQPRHAEGFWESLKHVFAPDEDKHTYAEGLHRGGYLVSVQTDGTHYDRVLNVLDNEGAVDMNEREAQWRQEGWTAPAAATAPVAARSSQASDENLAARGAVGQDESIELVEENLRVGKRDINHGRVRLRSYVVETPVHESVSLRSEQVEVDRRPVNRAIQSGDALFEERVLEAEEHVEEAVISKEARVVGEVSLRKTVQDRTHQVDDTVRRTEVKVDDERSGRSDKAVAGTSRPLAAAGAGAAGADIVEHMDVLASDGEKVGTVDHLEGSDSIKLTKSASPDGMHHILPLGWVARVDNHVHLTKTAAQVRAGWK